MIKNLLLVTLRNLKKDKWYSLLNILGLTIGITFSLFLIFYVRDELSYDRFNRNVDRIYRINSYIQEKDKNTNWCLTQSPLALTLKKDFPEVEEAVRFSPRERTLFKNGDKNFYETKIYYVDSNIFRIFTAEFLEGKLSDLRGDVKDIETYEGFLAVLKTTMAKGAKPDDFKDLFLTELDPSWMNKKDRFGEIIEEPSGTSDEGRAAERQ